MNRYRNILLTAMLLMLSAAAAVNAQITVQTLRCEMLNNPLGIDVQQPRLSWQLAGKERNIQQVAYQVLVASTPEKLEKGEGDLWNSGKVTSGQSIHIDYKGKPLTSRTTGYWKVKSWTNRGETSWSETAHWSMGLSSRDWKAKWIGLEKGMPWDSITQWSRLSARYFRKTFTQSRAGAVKKATVYVSGLGLYHLYINGKKVGDHELAPAATDYTKSILYNTFDVTGLLQQGNNVVAAVLGNGRYFTMRQNYKPKKIKAFGYPKLLLQLEIEYTNGTKKSIVTDATWKMTADGPIRTNNEYDGEEYDANKELTGWNNTGYDDKGWMQPQVLPATGVKLAAQMNEPIKVMQTIKPVRISQLKPGVFIMDMGQNMVGNLEMRLKAIKGQQVQLRFAESLQPNGELYVANLRDAKVTDRYTAKGNGIETWRPAFVFHGFRYVEITGYAGTPTVNDFEGRVIYDDLATTGTFETSNEIVNQIHKNAWWGISGNYKGMPLDCPQRNERMPWLADHAIGSLGESFLFANGNLYAKWLQDIEEAQTTEGSIPDVAPAYWNYYSDNMTWPGTYLIIADMLYNQYGDKRAIEKHYASMKKWLAYMQGKYMKDYLIAKDKYGDWCVPPESPELIHSKDSLRKTDGTLIASAYFYRMLWYMQKFAGLINKPEDAKAFAGLGRNIQEAFNKRFYNKQKKCYDNNTVTANLLPVYFGITPDSAKQVVFDKIAHKIWVENHGHISTGVIGTQWLMRCLSDYQLPDLAYTLISDTTYPSWGYMVKNGATTIWELWNGNTAKPSMNSQNHVMLLGDLLVWMYENAAGIKSDDKAAAFKKIIMQPTPLDGLDFVNASYNSVHGVIKSSWKSSIGRFTWNVTIPANTTALLYIPADDVQYITESGKPVSAVDGLRFIKMEGKKAVFEAGSGEYSFVSTYKFKDGIVTDEFIFNKTSFPESHAATIAETPKGLVTAWFGGTKERNPDVGIWISRQVNNEWTAPVEVANGKLNDTLRYACWNPVLFQIPNGDLLLFYKVGPNVAGWKAFLTRSTDNGVTWGKPQAMPDGFLGPVKNKPVMLGNGDIICPSSKEGNGWTVHFEVSSDQGRTWRMVGPINPDRKIFAIQPGILVHKDGKLQILCRSKSAAVVESWSADNGKTWSPLTPSSLPNNNSGTDAVTLHDGRHLIVYNHVATPKGAKKGARTPLNVAVSKDGKEWNAALVLEDSPVSQYSYPSVIQSADGMIHIVYTWRRQRVKYVKVDPAKLKLVPIEEFKSGVKEGDSEL
ncbi:family 78 glycoside hydrolase catalytic domain [Niastella populi]|uniref:alpha-L-rhamnosidase n=1 Tax=Niastella populi TaxID=550983 RepID=A0A1V9FNC1_9BACT|nr:family 78 glycoside hydrolase catalytic domain [Niastella populi]OQP59855.1 alpha-rhamnosidase [Niastella populi]